jgi:2-dehydropantoate 2-reductase
VLVRATKSQDAGTLADWAGRPVEGGGLAADLPVVLTQNGLDAERVALRYFSTVVGGVALVAARHVVPGEVEVITGPRTGQLVVGAYPSAALAPHAVEVAAQVAEDLRAANWLSQAVDEVERWLAWKVQVNATFGVSVLTGSAEDLARLKGLIVAEVREVLGVACYDFADPATELEYDASEASNHAGGTPHQPSTWQSFARGTGSEVDFLNGEVVLLARLHGLRAPYHEALQRVLGHSAALGEQPGTHSVDEVLSLADRTASDAGQGAVA